MVTVSMNVLWGAMLLIGIVYAAFTGNMQAVTDAALSSAKEAVNLCITMSGVLALWMGLMEIAKACGIVGGISKKLRPFLKFLFPQIPTEHPAMEHIAVNFTANFLGLGWAATPAGLLAMKSLAELEARHQTVQRGSASNAMCTFLILNISSLQLIPVNMIAYRSQYGSVNPAVIVGPGIVATAISTAAAILFCRIANHFTQNLHSKPLDFTKP